MPAVARLMHKDGPRYPLGTFAQAEPKGMGTDVAKQPKVEIDWDRALKHARWLRSSADLPEDFSKKGKIIVEHDGTLQELNEVLVEAGLLKKPYRSWSDVTQALAAIFKSYGKISLEKAAAGLMTPLPCNRHVTTMKAEAARQRAVYRALNRSHEPIASIAKFNGDGPLVSEWDHMTRARVFVEKRRQHLHHYRGDFTDYDRGRHAAVEDDTVKADVYGFLDGCGKMVGDEPMPFQPGITSVNETVAAAKAVGHLLPTLTQPCWLDGRDEPDPVDLVSFPNGIYDLRTETFMRPDPLLFTPNAAGFEYDPEAPEPVEWKKFLAEIYADEQDQIDAWQEWCGYCVSSDTSQEKAGLLIGDKRSGKDTSRNVLQSLLPAEAMIGPTLDSMGRPFGMQPFINK